MGDLPEVLQNFAGHQGQKLVGWLLSPPSPQQIVKLSCERLNSAMSHRAACTGLHPCNETYRAGLDFNLLLALGGFWKNHFLGVRITQGIANANSGNFYPAHVDQGPQALECMCCLIFP